MRGGIEGFGGGLRFSDSLIFGGGKLNQVFFYVTVVSFKYGFFLFVFVCLFVSLRVCVGKYYLALIEALGVFFCLHPSLIPVTSNPNGATPPGYRTVSRQEEGKNIVFAIV